MIKIYGNCSALVIVKDQSKNKSVWIDIQSEIHEYRFGVFSA